MDNQYQGEIVHLLVNKAYNKTRYKRVKKRSIIYIIKNLMERHRHLTGIRAHLFLVTLTVLESEVAYPIV